MLLLLVGADPVPPVGVLSADEQAAKARAETATAAVRAARTDACRRVDGVNTMEPPKGLTT